MRIGIDARFLTHPQFGGFKTYTECLIQGLTSIDHSNEYILYTDRTPKTAFCLPPNFNVRVVPGGLPLLGMPLREQISLPWRALRDDLDVFHSPCLSAPLGIRCPLVVTIHDMLWKQHRNGTQPVHQRLMNDYYRWAGKQSARRAAIIVTVSESAKSEIVEQMGIPPERVVVTLEAPRAMFRIPAESSQKEAVRRKFSLPGQFLLCLGAPDPRKQIAMMIESYALLPTGVRDRFPLVVLWSHPSANAVEARVAQLGLSHQVHFRMLPPSNAEMVSIYNLASLFVFPSRHEGFGLPPLEAMACGVPVVASRNSSMPEVLGDAALLVDTNQPANLAAAIASVLTDPEQAESLQRKGLERADLFSWETCAANTLDTYSDAAMRVKPRKATPAGSSVRSIENLRP